MEQQILITAKTKAKVSDAVNEIRVICKDNLSLTAYSDPKQAKGSYKKMIKDGKQVVFKDGMILERFEDLKKEQIADNIEKDIKALRRKLGKLIRVDYSRRVI